LIAQAIEEDLTLVTSDRAFSLYSGLRVLPA
jgi:PIN domain nuclease of toxin-antitoxin system